MSDEGKSLHELPIAQGILESVLRAAAGSGATRVSHIHVVVGDVSGVSVECVEFYWDSISRGTLAHGAAFHVRRVPFEMTCLVCSHTFSPTAAALGYDCPSCGGARVRMSHGQECYLEAIDVDANDDAETGSDPAHESRTPS
ncbi:MAG: hydrogenase maturation nickel metallochaperone HypA [Phycisphaerales bacterium]|nr:hydrogenase maturation nickel metallochaperone HypA [Phycisphaerales bacterium]